jgi:hypothetical protein
MEPRPHRLLPAALAALAIAAGGCGSAITGPDTPIVRPASSPDAEAGSWRMILLARPDQIEVPEPEPVTSEAYRGELAAVSAAQRQLTDEQREVIRYWSAGGVRRWNEILRELVARYNLPPAPRPDGTYPLPNAAAPFDDPQFPFSNPPYAARAYSYVSVAQYEALKVAWHHKYRFRRAAPSQVDTAVTAIVSAGDLPAYPSEDAALSAVTEALLRALFPASVEEIAARAADQRNAALWSGRAAPSDLSAGAAIGQAVAQIALARAGADGMRNAVGTAAQWQELANRATGRGEIAWKSIEQPPRPPMLPFFGQVRGWMMTETDFANERPQPPPSTSGALMQQELAEVRRTVDNLTREQVAIVYKWADGVATYTPPGHWNHIAADYLETAGFSEVRAARVYALLNMAMHDAAVGCWETKFFYFNPRPSQLDPGLKTPTGVPNFPAFTSGHSTFSAAAADVLSHVFPGRAAELQAMRDEAAISRLYGGIHFRSDIEAGKDHGRRIAGYTLRFASEDGAR